MSHAVQVVNPVPLILLLVLDKQSLPHLCLLPRLVVLVEPLEVGGYDGDGKGEDQDPRHGAHAPKQLSQARSRLSSSFILYVVFSCKPYVGAMSP